MKKTLVSVVLLVGLCVLPGLAQAKFNFSPYFGGGLSYLNVTNQDMIVDGNDNSFAMDYKGGYSATLGAGLQLLNDSRAMPWFGVVGAFNFANLESAGGINMSDTSMNSLSVSLTAGLDVNLSYGFYLNFGGYLGYANLKLDAAASDALPFTKYSANAINSGVTVSFGKGWENGLFIQANYRHTWLHEFSDKASITYHPAFNRDIPIKIENTRFQTFGIDIGFSF